LRPRTEIETRPPRQRDSASEVVFIEPPRRWEGLQLRALWDNREVAYFLCWRDIKVRYKQTSLGIAWAVIQPLATALVFAVLFGRVARMPSDGLPYSLFALAGLLPWTLFSEGLTRSSRSLISSSELIKKVYFPRMLVPLSSLLSVLLDFAVGLVLLFAATAWFGVGPSVRLIALPAVILLAIVTAVGVGLWLAALSAEFRDFSYVVPFMLQLWMFASPVIYPASLVSRRLAERGLPTWLYGINPMVGVVEGFRWAVLSVNTNPSPLIVASIVSAFVLLATGSVYFRRVEQSLVDVL
jgi:lipopolysaccharide transport system permease protein